MVYVIFVDIVIIETTFESNALEKLIYLYFYVDRPVRTLIQALQRLLQMYVIAQ
jgi:hypothetical protein